MKIYLVHRKIFWSDNTTSSITACKRKKDVKRYIDEETQKATRRDKLLISNSYATTRVDAEFKDMPQVSFFIEPTDMITENHFLHGEPT